MKREAIKYENQISWGSMEWKAETQSFIYEFLFYITERNLEPSQLSKIEFLVKLVNSLILLSFFEQSYILDVMRFWIKFLKFVKNMYYRFTISVLLTINLHSVEINVL